jgi:hypothetical protein
VGLTMAQSAAATPLSSRRDLDDRSGARWSTWHHDRFGDSDVCGAERNKFDSHEDPFRMMEVSDGSLRGSDGAR